HSKLTSATLYPRTLSTSLFSPLLRVDFHFPFSCSAFQFQVMTPSLLSLLLLLLNVFDFLCTSEATTVSTNLIYGNHQMEEYSQFLLANGVALTPPMGWNSWNHFQCNVDEHMVKSTADALVSTGLAAQGYRYVNIDDCWGELARDSKGNLRANSSTFPSGIKALSDYVHSKGLKLGIYSDAGFRTCSMKMPGSLHHEEQDARTFAEWGVDYLKYDNCYHDGSKTHIRYAKMSSALLKVRRPILYSICTGGQEDPAKWAGRYGNAWRTTGDINDTWASMTSNADQNNIWGRYAGPGRWNDPDMLEVGNGGMSLEEYQSHFSIWSLMKAPLLIGCDVRTASKRILSILGNKEVIEVNQDPLGVQGRKIRSKAGLEIWAGPLSRKRSVVVLWNKSKSKATISVRWREIGISPETPLTVRDLWAHRFVAMGKKYGLAARVAPHACEMFILSRPESDPVLVRSTAQGLQNCGPHYLGLVTGVARFMNLLHFFLFIC
ncbi:Alpha-galactosidase 2, partial [Linum perenne]